MFALGIKAGYRAQFIAVTLTHGNICLTYLTSSYLLSIYSLPFDPLIGQSRTMLWNWVTWHGTMAGYCTQLETTRGNRCEMASPSASWQRNSTLRLKKSRWCVSVSILSYSISYSIFPIHIESIQIHSSDMYFCDDSLKHRLMVSHHVLTLTCICSHQGYAYCVYSDRCMGATQPVSQSNPACRPAWLLFWTTFQPAICELMYCMMCGK